MHTNQRVIEMVGEVLARQAVARARRTGESLEDALAAVLGTEAGRQLRKLRDGPHGYEKADEWQANVARRRAEERTEALGWRSPRKASDYSSTDG